MEGRLSSEGLGLTVPVALEPYDSAAETSSQLGAYAQAVDNRREATFISGPAMRRSGALEDNEAAPPERGRGSELGLPAQPADSRRAATFISGPAARRSGALGHNEAAPHGA